MLDIFLHPLRTRHSGIFLLMLREQLVLWERTRHSICDPWETGVALELGAVSQRAFFGECVPVLVRSGVSHFIYFFLGH